MNNIDKKYGRCNIGKEFTTSEGCICSIVDGGRRRAWVTIRFEKPVKYDTEVRIDALKSGSVKNRYLPSVCNKGFLGVGDYSKGSNPKYYMIWISMIRRAYSEYVHERQPTYRNVEVCEDWLCFQEFSKWLDSNYVDGWSLDKDLLSQTNKIYSPNTCVFMPVYINNLLPNININNKSGHTGVCYVSREDKYQSMIHGGDGTQIYLGKFKLKKDAIDAYDKARIKKLNKVVCRYKRDAIILGVKEDVVNLVIAKIYEKESKIRKIIK